MIPIRGVATRAAGASREPSTGCRRHTRSRPRCGSTIISSPRPDEADDWHTALNPSSLEVVRGARLEPALAGVDRGSRFQFERQGYFCVDERDSSPSHLVFNRSVGLRDTWAKIESKG